MSDSVHWLIQRNQADTTDVRRVAEALEADGIPVHLVDLERGGALPPLPDLPNNVPVVCHGPAFIPRALKHPRLRPWVFFDLDTFRWSRFRAAWKEAMLSRDASVVDLAAAQTLLRARGQQFVRPDEDSKAFDGGVYTATELDNAVGKRVSQATPVVVASPVNVEVEWRFVVVGGEIVACSEYKRWGRASTDGSVPRGAIRMAEEIASLWGPASVYCLDLADTGDRLGVVEANCFNAARLYGCAVRRVVQAVNDHVLKQAAGCG
ncbi:MAG: ATP-grasp domain-containing protein [Bryobacteraceae bacterium]